jgi:hypothetical protein
VMYQGPLLGVGTAYSVTTPAVVIRPMFRSGLMRAKHAARKRESRQSTPDRAFAPPPLRGSRESPTLRRGGV